jgi:hypothetical protein
MWLHTHNSTGNNWKQNHVPYRAIAIALTVSHRVQSQGSSCVISGRKRCSRAGITRVLWFPILILIPSNFPFSLIYRSRDNSVGIATGYELDCRGSIPGRGRSISSTPQHTDQLWGPPSLLYNGCCGENRRRRKLTTHLHLVPRPRMVELYLHSQTRLHGVVLN